MKFCPICRQDRPLYLFGRSRLTLDGLSETCLRCRAENPERSAAIKPITDPDALDPRALVEFRARYGLSQSGAAQALGCSTMSISNWERRIHAIPHTVRLAMSAFVAGLPPYGS